RTESARFRVYLDNVLQIGVKDMPRVLVVGSVNMDLIVRCRRVPGPGQTVHGEDLVVVGGGKGANQAVAASRLGADTTFIGRVGEDDFGDRLHHALEHEGVDVHAVMRDPEAPSGVALILLEEDGQNRIVVMGGANNRLDDTDIRAARTLLKQTDILLMQLEIPLTVVAEVARAARKLGVRSVLDAGPATTAAAELGIVGLFDVLSPNESETEVLTDIRVNSLDDASRAAARLRDMGAQEVVIKLGAQGAYWQGAEGDQHVPGFPVEPVDTTAAGDAFTACLAVSLGLGRPVLDCIRRANAAGALACLRLGAQPSMPTQEELDDFLRARTT
ncbi:MAG: ribokinase, partial [Armatimonadetes bacterium]|nr:ribokinase [Armatimonadota bacterium]